MPTLLISTSLLAAFIAGVAALLAPCCVSVLLPSYLANVFKERYKIFYMTFVFFLGMLTVFLPIGLGASILAQTFSRFHNQIFMVGGIFLFVLGLSMLLGKGFSTPASIRDRFKKHVTSIYLLGVFSAIATTCCAPVLAGVVALSVTSGKIIWGIIYTLAYVFGMVLPLFVISILLDKFDLAKKLTNIKKTVALKIFNYSWTITTSELISGLIFIGMGSYITYLAFNNRLFMSSELQLKVNLFMGGFLSHLNGFILKVPQGLWALIIILIFVYLLYAFIKQVSNRDNE